MVYLGYFTAKEVSEVVRMFNQRPHPKEMTPEERAHEMRKLIHARLPLRVWSTRMIELANRGMESFINSKNTVVTVTEEARNGSRMTTAPLEMIAEAECSPAPMPSRILGIEEL